MLLQVFKSMKLKFHNPKKDACGLCESYRNGNETEKAKLKDQFETHISEKEKVRNIKSSLKCHASLNDKINVCSFDLQQVIFLPKTNRSEIFYSRRLSCYNFTISDVNSKHCECFLWHEGIAGRGSNEIASCVYQYLKRIDANSVRHVFLFADGCSGQNKNSILPCMLLYFVQNSVNVQSITIRYFEPHHGQNEGDAVHSCVERAIKRIPEIMTPSELSAIIKMARLRSTTSVTQVDTGDILNWKDLAKNLSILRIREANDGSLEIDWKKVRELQVNKDSPSIIGFKMSHHDDVFAPLDLKSRRNFVEMIPYPMPAYDEKTEVERRQVQ
ncbi:uncharacterized protein LOC141911149 [Tubulanus polymorphus]|uniref:uncharacterized protein LOC141911149 n=1 Tax=Tubulanus polymorphus TaxID=672921 RepID=UPI003DA2B1AA